MSTTPRTDATLKDLVPPDYGGPVYLADFARELERELSTATAAHAATKAELAEATKTLTIGAPEQTDRINVSLPRDTWERLVKAETELRAALERVDWLEELLKKFAAVKECREIYAAACRIRAAARPDAPTAGE